MSQGTSDHTPRVLVTDASRGSATSIIRSLGRKGWHVIAADASRLSPGMYSRYARDKLCYPAPESRPCEFVNTLVAAAQQQQIDLILPVTDSTILPLSAARDRFQDLCQLALPTASSLEVVTNKLKTMQLARDLGVPTPRTHLVNTVREALDCCLDLGWPLVLKPQSSKLCHDGGATESLVVSYAQDKPSLRRQMERFEDRCPVLLQQYVEGVGYGVELLMHQGRPLAAFQHRRLREVPVYGGPSALRESVPLDPQLYEYSLRLLQAVTWTGLAMVEFKIGERDAALMEINGRVWGSLPLAVHCGMDFPARLAELWLRGAPVVDQGPDTSYKIGVRGHNFELEMKWIVSVLFGLHRVRFLEIPSRHHGLTALAELFSPAYKFDVISLRDPKPGFLQVVRTFSKLFSMSKKSSASAKSRQAPVATTQYPSGSGQPQPVSPRPPKRHRTTADKATSRLPKVTPTVD